KPDPLMERGTTDPIPQGFEMPLVQSRTDLLVHVNLLASLVRGCQPYDGEQLRSRVGRERLLEGRLDPKEIFELIVKADEALKYATEEKAAVRTRQARDLLTRARDEARTIGNQGLVDQAERRLADLDELPGGPPG